MNGDIRDRDYFGGFIEAGAAVRLRARRGRLTEAVCAFFCAFSLTAYTAAGIYLADRIFSSDVLVSMLSPIFCAEAEENTDERITVTVERAPEENKTDGQNSEGGASGTSGTDTNKSNTDGAVAEYPIAGANLSCADTLSLSNQTGYKPDTAALAAKAASCIADADAGDGPLVLIVHTHGTEAYSPEGETTYNDNTSFRSNDTSQNVIAVGAKVCEALEAAGIGVIHCQKMFDEESYIDSYAKCAAEIRDCLEKYPSIRYVLDVHRDAVFRGDMTLVAPVTDDGAAQIMLVCGTDELGADFPDWQDNLSFAIGVQYALQASYPDLMRNINLRKASFNEQLAERFLLVEIGSAGNTLAQACEAGTRFGEVFAGVIGGQPNMS